MARSKKSKGAQLATGTKDASTTEQTAARSRRRKAATETDTYASDSSEQRQSTGRARAIQSPQIPSNVVKKLVVFSIVLLIAPILAYFFSLNLVFAGSTTPAAITAAVTANIVLAGYVYAAWVEENDDNSADLKRKSD